MKIILSDLTMTKVYSYKLIEDKTVINGYVSYDATSIASSDTARTFDYNISLYKHVKIVAAAGANSAPYARFVDSNGTLVGTKITYTKSGETELAVPTGAVKIQVTDTYGNKSNQVSLYGKKA